MSSGWFDHNVPSSALGLHLLDQEFPPCLRYWLGLPIVAEGWEACPVCWSAFGEVTGIVSIVATLSGMQYSQQHRQLL